ncbi:hypothetical protein KKG90_05445 [Candidatus Bipolaricaulota bacterium]|nr:hypothetical protein [Candidatus Bipolaricaulota bacterium]
MTRKAHADYARSRGTLHARQLHAGIAKHELALRPLIVERERIGAAIDSLARGELNELRKSLANDLVHGPLAEIRGVGSKLKNRIVESCFDGTLESLNTAQQVPGVGPEMALDIQTWIQQMQNRMPQLLKGDFEGKAAIVDAYQQQRSVLSTQRARLERMIQRRTDMLAQAKRKMASLETATPAIYRQALLGDVQAAERVAAHTLGVFPEWEDAPDWFAELITDPEREMDGI